MHPRRLGADVVKVERPGGDPMRSVFADVDAALGGNPIFELDNRGKRGIVLDIAKPEGREALSRLAAGADVFLTNVAPGVAATGGARRAGAAGAQPRLIYAVVTGYGLEGPDAHLPGFDVTAFWARAGVANMTAPKGTDPFMIRTGVGDHITSLATVSAILAALYERERTGKGRLVETSLLKSGIWTMGSDLAVQLKFGRLISARTRDNPLNACPTCTGAATDAGSCTTPGATRTSSRPSARPRDARNWCRTSGSRQGEPDVRTRAS
jgi:crotonobetainyl-CoA:carnitine CoA-transferase CaiB-like acyl-CoA transferase